MAVGPLAGRSSTTDSDDRHASIPSTDCDLLLLQAVARAAAVANIPFGSYNKLIDMPVAKQQVVLQHSPQISRLAAPMMIADRLLLSGPLNAKMAFPITVANKFSSSSIFPALSPISSQSSYLLLVSSFNLPIDNFSFVKHKL